MNKKLDIAVVARAFIILLLLSVLFLLILEIRLRKGMEYPLNAIVYDSELGWKFSPRKSYIMDDFDAFLPGMPRGVEFFLEI